MNKKIKLAFTVVTTATVFSMLVFQNAKCMSASNQKSNSFANALMGLNASSILSGNSSGPSKPLKPVFVDDLKAKVETISSMKGQFSTPSDIAIDSNGNVYISDTLNNVIKKYSPKENKLSVFAGSGGIGAQDGKGSAAIISQPMGITTDSSGNVYVADNMYLIRKISPAGDVTTIAGSEGVRGSNDGTSGASFSASFGLAVDASGNVIVADSDNHTVRKITPQGVVSTLAGKAGQMGYVDGSGVDARFRAVKGLAIDSSGNIFVADTWNGLIRKIATDGTVSTVAGKLQASWRKDGPISAATFVDPTGLAFDSSGNLIVTEQFGGSIRKIDFKNQTVSTIDYGFLFSRGLAINSSGDLFFLEELAGVLHKYVPSAQRDYILVGKTEPIFTETTAYLNAITNDTNGNIYGVNDRSLYKMKTDGTFAPIAEADRKFVKAMDVSADSAGNLYITDQFGHTIKKLSSSTGRLSIIAGVEGSPGYVDGDFIAARFSYPLKITADRSGNLFITETNNSFIRKISNSGVVSTFAGAIVGGYQDGAATQARFNVPRGMCTDPQGNLYVTDMFNDAIRKVTPAGVVSTFAGQAGLKSGNDGTGLNANFNYQSGIACDAFGNVYIADTDNRTIRKIYPSGRVGTLAGLSTKFGFDDGVGADARFGMPMGIAFDSAGILYILDLFSTIRKVTE